MSKQASRRVAQFNLLFTPSELRELKKRADRDTGGNVSELIRRAMFPKSVEPESKGLTGEQIVQGMREVKQTEVSSV